jgi:hypothetical protein
MADERAKDTDEVTRAEYLSDYLGAAAASERQKEALKHALDIRKFEIDLYWKRAGYFWTLIAAAFAGYFVAANAAKPQFLTLFVLACLGLVFSAAWYLVNRGSKAWQRNWETHVDVLEDEVMGPLHKTGLNRYEYSFGDVLNAYPISPSKVNQILGLFVIAIWPILLSKAFSVGDWNAASDKVVAIIGSVLTLAALIALVRYGRTSKSDETVVIHKRTRMYAREK